MVPMRRIATLSRMSRDSGSHDRKGMARTPQSSKFSTFVASSFFVELTISGSTTASSCVPRMSVSYCCEKTVV